MEGGKDVAEFSRIFDEKSASSDASSILGLGKKISPVPWVSDADSVRPSGAQDKTFSKTAICKTILVQYPVIGGLLQPQERSVMMGTLYGLQMPSQLTLGVVLKMVLGVMGQKDKPTNLRLVLK